MRFLIFKLKHDLANDSELVIARAEVEALVGRESEEILNLADFFFKVRAIDEAVRSEDTATQRIQHVLLRMPYPGRYQALVFEDVIPDIGKLKKRLTYIRDLFLVCTTQQMLVALKQCGVCVRNVAAVRKRFGESFGPSIRVFSLPDANTPWLVRIVTDHAFIECSDHAVRLAQQPRDVDRIYSGAVHHLASNFDRAFSPSVSVGYKWIEDFIDDRRAPNAYASHSLFGLRGRFFPRMVRALSNTLLPNSGALLDPFGGVGILGIEAALLGISSYSFDINPLFTLISRAKHKALVLSSAEETQLEHVRDYAQSVRTKAMPITEVDDAAVPKIPGLLSRFIKQDNLRLIAALKCEVDRTCSKEVAMLAYLAIAYYAKSMATKYTNAKILTGFWAHISKILYLSRFMQHLYKDGLCDRPADAAFETQDVKQLSNHFSEASAVITSPHIAPRSIMSAMTQSPTTLSVSNRITISKRNLSARQSWAGCAVQRWSSRLTTRICQLLHNPACAA
jgi:hypothetical protein